MNRRHFCSRLTVVIAAPLLLRDLTPVGTPGAVMLHGQRFQTTDGTVYQWVRAHRDFADGELVMWAHGHPAGVTTCAISKDNHGLVRLSGPITMPFVAR